MWECKNTWVRLGTYNQSLSLSTCYISLGVETHMLTLWPLLQPPRHRVYLRVILVEDLCKPTEVKREMVHIHQIRVGPSWMDPKVLFLREDILPEEKSKADKVRRKALQFWLSKDLKLYKCSFSGPYLLCIHLEASELLLEELHEGICGSHKGGRSLSHKSLT